MRHLVKLLLPLLVIYGIAYGGAVTISVCASGCDETTVAAGVAAAGAGEAVYIHNGTYSETADVTDGGTDLARIYGESEDGVIINLQNNSGLSASFTGDGYEIDHLTFVVEDGYIAVGTAFDGFNTCTITSTSTADNVFIVPTPSVTDTVYFDTVSFGDGTATDIPIIGEGGAANTYTRYTDCVLDNVKILQDDGRLQMWNCTIDNTNTAAEQALIDWTAGGVGFAYLYNTTISGVDDDMGSSPHTFGFRRLDDNISLADTFMYSNFDSLDFPIKQSDSDGAHATATKSYVYACSLEFFSLYGIFTTTNDGDIIDSYFKSGHDELYTITIGHDGPSCNTYNKGQGWHISGCTFDACDSPIRVFGQECQIYENNFIDFTANGIGMEGADQPYIVNNRFYSGNKAIALQIEDAVECTDGMVKNNWFIDNTKNYYFDSATSEGGTWDFDNNIYVEPSSVTVFWEDNSVQKDFSDWLTDGKDALSDTTTHCWRSLYGGDSSAVIVPPYGYVSTGLTQTAVRPNVPHTFPTLTMADDSLLAHVNWAATDTITCTVRNDGALMDYIDYRANDDDLYLDVTGHILPTSGYE
jgi:hypothetical protein